ncbi:MAG: DNA primase [Burkholderiaceae bacterium]|uniref:DNA primase n=1 Tax=Candidatus Skiveiella danica TaxID=3386177 RepID=UPI001B74DA7D|nr:DNA primase [Betaproteobacteria bacterium]MBP8101818.1 DNA primase [Burkholderiaceae bacterium]
MAIPQSFITELLSRVDVVEVVGRYVQLKKGGANFMGLCPFHGEKSPSFSVSPTKQFYHCFGCGKNGNAISFLMDHAGMNFVEAVKELAGQIGLQVPEEERSPQERERAAAERQKQATLTDVLEKAGEAWRKQLKGSPRAVAYLKGRGLSGEIARRFGLGYAPDGWHGLASVFPAYDDPLLLESGLVIVATEDGSEARRYDRFRDRIMFPIRNVKGECIGFGGRVLGDEKPKYLNSPETPVFHKGRELYGLFEARQALREAGYVLVTEGYMDVVALAQLGFPNAVATLGTACTPEHVQKLFRFTDSVVFSFDGDAAGRRAARKALDGALPHATDVRTVKFLFLPAEHDPDSFIREFGNDAFARCVSEAVPLSRFLIEAASEGCDLATAEGRAHLASNAKPLWNALPEGALKRQLLGDIAEQVQLHARELSDVWSDKPARAPGAVRPGRKYQNDSYQGPSDDGDWPKSFKSTAPRSNLGARLRPASRADHAARLLLSRMDLWDALTAEDHAMLCELPPPHGTLFVWLDHQFHDQGALPWGQLRDQLAGRDFEAKAQELMGDYLGAGFAGTAGGEPGEASRELRGLMNLLLIDRIARLEKEAVAQASNDPAALDRLRALHERRRILSAARQPD